VNFTKNYTLLFYLLQQQTSSTANLGEPEPHHQTKSKKDKHFECNRYLEVWWNIVVCRMKQSLIEIHKQRELTVLKQSKFILSAQHFSTLNINSKGTI